MCHSRPQRPRSFGQLQESRPLALIADFRCWEWPEASILGADQKDRGLLGREYGRVFESYAYAIQPEVRYFRTSNRIADR